MHVWMGVALTGLIGSLTVYGLLWVLSNLRQQQLRKQALEEDAIMFGGSSLVNRELIEQYDAAKRTVFDVVKGPLGLNERMYTCKVAMGEDPAQSWMRKLSPELNNPLRGRLLRRACAALPKMHALPNDLQAKYQLLQRGLIAESQWQRILKAKDELAAELESVKSEAECLAENWGNQNLIFRDATLVHQQQMKQMQQAAAAEAISKHQQTMKEKLANTSAGESTSATGSTAKGTVAEIGPKDDTGSATTASTGNVVIAELPLFQGPPLPATLAAFRQAQQQAALGIMGLTPQEAEEMKRQQIINAVQRQKEARAKAAAAAAPSVLSSTNQGVLGDGRDSTSNGDSDDDDSAGHISADLTSSEPPDPAPSGAGASASSGQNRLPLKSNSSAARTAALRQRLSAKKAALNAETQGGGPHASISDASEEHAREAQVKRETQIDYVVFRPMRESILSESVEMR